MRPGLGPNVMSNFGLFDQIAALEWIKDNIHAFRGDPGAVTLIGHGTGANLVSLLLTTPAAVASGNLFHRAVLMSGTALSPMSVCRDPREITLQVVKQLNCSTLNDAAISKCLKDARLQDLLKVRVKYIFNVFSSSTSDTVCVLGGKISSMVKNT